MIITLPIPGFIAIICFAVFRLPGHGVQIAPGLPLGLIQLFLFFLGELFVGDELLHGDTSVF